MAYEWIKLDSKVIGKLVPLIEATPGIESRVLAKQAGLSYTHVKNALAVISRNNIAGCVELGQRRRGWFMEPEASRRNEGFVSQKQQQKNRAAARPPTSRDRIMVIAQQREDGASIARVSDLLDLGRKDAHRHLLQMVKQDRLFLSRRPGAVGRWFDTPERAQAWAAMPEVVPTEWQKKPGRPALNKPKKEPAIKAPKLVAIGERIKNKTRQPSKAPPLLAGSQKNRKPNEVIRAKPGTDATVTLHGKATDMRGTVDYSRAKITICPAPQFNYRHEYAPGSEAWTGFAAEWQRLRGAA